MTCFVASEDGAWLVVGWRSLLLKQYSLETWKCTRSWKVRWEGHRDMEMHPLVEGKVGGAL